MSCESCEALIIEYDVDNPAQEVISSAFEVEDQLPRLPRLSKNSDDGCEFCCLLAETVQEAAEQKLSAAVRPNGPTPVRLENACFETEATRRSDATGDDNGVYSLKMKLKVGDNEARQLYFSVHADEGSKASTSGRIQRKRLQPSAVSQTCISRIKQWIHECEGHPMCTLSGETFTPTRLINVGTCDSPTVRLEACERTSGLRYIALSHCWGPPDPQKPMLKTETHTISERMEGIALTIMPKNFQDAVAVTRHLGIEYIWIDSLCIIQDSAKDWQREAATMDQVYKHAYVTLAATSTKTSHDGFLERSLGREVRIPFKSSKDASPDGFFYLQPALGDPSCGFEVNVQCSAWNTRGWTLQERYLSRRLIHFCRDQAYFECRAELRAEDGHKILHLPTPAAFIENETFSDESETESDSLADGSRSDTEELGLSKTNESSEDDQEGGSEADDEDYQYTQDDPTERMFERWSKIIGDYSTRQLTYGTDKLPALSALAKETSSAGLVGRYLAGIWEKDLIYGLLWICRANDGDFSPAPTYRAPSWSWACLDGQIIWGGDWDRGEMPPVFELLQADIEPSGLDPFGAIATGRLVISGALAPVSIGEPDGALGPRAEFLHHLVYDDTDIGHLHLDLRSPSLVSSRLFALQLFEQYPRTSDQGNNHVWCGLLVERSSTRANEFCRVGLFFLDEDHLDVFESLEPGRIILV